MRYQHVLFVAAVAIGVSLSVWPAYADDTPAPAPTVSVTPSYPDPPQKPIPSGPADPVTPPTGEPMSPPPLPPGGGLICDPADPDCVPADLDYQ